VGSGEGDGAGAVGRESEDIGTGKGYRGVLSWRMRDLYLDRLGGWVS